VPIPDPARRNTKSERILLKGDVPSPISPPSGCRFHTRCWKATEICKTTEPPLLELKPGQQVACHHPENFADQAPQDTVLLSVAKEAVELVPRAVLAESTTVAVQEATGLTGPTAKTTEEPEAPAGGTTAATGEKSAEADVEESPRQESTDK
jgi:peptide/nickel transport system ATP-binding protein